MKKTDLQRLTAVMENKNLSVAQVVELIERHESVNNVDDEIKLTVDYTKTIGQAIVDGKYDWKSTDITKNFPVSPEMIGKKVDVSAKLFHFNRNISSDDAISEMDKAGYRPATLMELLTLGILFPELQKKFPIISLGSDGGRWVPYLIFDGSGRRLDLRWFDGGWNALCRFLGVRKS